MTRPKLIIFDCDGVLVDSEPLTRAFLLRDLARFGLNLTMQDCDRPFVGGTMRECAASATLNAATVQNLPLPGPL
jgi:beta-phosphoglucomutase-like phosphatase (HAD superfamily)